MSLFDCVALFLLSVGSVSAKDNSTYSFFSPTNGKTESHSIPIRNNGSIQIKDIKVQVDCGCVHIETVPETLKAGETQSIVFSIMHPTQDERKVNIITVEGKPDFQESIKIVNYFYSAYPQMFGDTVIHIREIPSLASVKTAVIIGDSTITNLNVISDERLGVSYDLSKALEFKNQNGCFKRILKIYVDPVRLLREKKEMVYVRVAANGKQVLLSAE